MHIPQIQHTASGNGLYTVFLDGVAQTPEHSTIREADEHSANLKLANPASTVIYTSNQVVTTTISYLADPVAEPPPPAPAPTPAPSYLFSESFTNGSFDTPWDQWVQNGVCNLGTTMTISPDAAYRGTHGLDIYYKMTKDPANPGGCGLHMDNNTSITKVVSPSLKHFFARGYFRFPFSTEVLCSTPSIQRKLIYFKPENYNVGSDGWSFFLVCWPWPNCATDGYDISLAYGGQNGMATTAWGDSPNFGFDAANNHVRVNQWYYLECEVLFGAYGQDTMRIWLSPAEAEPILIFNRSDLNLRSQADAAANMGISNIEIGRQVDISRDNFSQGPDEHRHWDEIVVSTTRIGKI